MARRFPYPSQPYNGNLPSMAEVGPSDLRYTSGTAPRFENQMMASHGRWLAGLGASPEETGEPAYALNELRLMAELDDAEGNGIFDPPGTAANIYPDAGVFANNQGLPGYLARERMYAESEVRDATTGRPIVVVNGGAVSMDDAAQVAFLEQSQYPLNPLFRADRMGRTGAQSTVNVIQNPVPIRKDAALGEVSLSRGQSIAAAAAAGVIAGAIYHLFFRKK